MLIPHPRRPLGFAAAFSTVVANIVGTGVFTTLGFLVLETTDGFTLLALWAVGGLIALAGALSYGELSAAIRGSGGEYRFLGRIYHPGVGAVAGWVSVAVGFAAPVALAAMALGRYGGPLVQVPGRTLAILAIVGATAVHLARTGSGWQGAGRGDDPQGDADRRIRRRRTREWRRVGAVVRANVGITG